MVIKMNRPYIICHMLISIDGKVTGDFLSKTPCATACDRYYEINRNLKPDAYACGRITMESSFTGSYRPDLTPYKGKKVVRTDFVADKNAKFFAVSFDRKGVVGWVDSKIHDEDVGYDNAHIIEVLSENVRDEYLAYLKDVGVSYIFAGKEDVDVKVAVEKLYKYFKIKLLLLEGGSIINGAFLRAGVIDELSLIVVPVLGDKDSLPLFHNGEYSELELLSTSPTISGSTHLRYKIKA